MRPEEKRAKTSTTKKASRLQGRDVASPALSDDAIAAQDAEEGIQGWGSSKKDYYDADVIETEGDALEEEAEAKRIQQKRLQSMNEADFGFDETDWAALRKDDVDTQRKVEGDVVTEVLPELQIRQDMSAEERLKLLKQRYPEFEPLSKDFVDLQPLRQELAGNIKRLSLATEKDISVSLIKWRALSAYLGAISMYFLLLASPARDQTDRCLAMAPSQLREHPLMETLIQCRMQWEEVRNLEELYRADVAHRAVQEVTIIDAAGGTGQKEMRETLPSMKVRKSKAQKAADKVQSASDSRRAERIRQTEAGLEELSKQLESYNSANRNSKHTSAAAEDESDFGDETALTSHEAAEKSKRKKSLRFYTSQIAQKSNKRDAAGRDAGGDADLPYRERLRDRQARLNERAEKRGRQDANEHERLGGDSDEDDYRASKEIRGDDGSNDHDYYDLVAARNKSKRENKKKLAEAQAEAAREGGRVEIQETISADGKRAITYAIEKNKGLTPRRNKDVRNPRVKKRKKFEEKKKKLGSIRQVYKGGESRGGYGGELTGIKKNLVKSVKL